MDLQSGQKTEGAIGGDNGQALFLGERGNPADGLRNKNLSGVQTGTQLGAQIRCEAGGNEHFERREIDPCGQQRRFRDLGMELAVKKLVNHVGAHHGWKMF